ncbi:MAG: hypothetical protein N2Z81_01930 [Hydrogenothermaceae bacterium]|nr:hypothetical protein [Hydrogenothermaceae bacterium]
MDKKLKESLDFALRIWDAEVKYYYPDNEYGDWDMTNTALAREELEEYKHLLTEEQKKKLEEIDRRALELYYKYLDKKRKHLPKVYLNKL